MLLQCPPPIGRSEIERQMSLLITERIHVEKDMYKKTVIRSRKQKRYVD